MSVCAHCNGKGMRLMPSFTDPQDVEYDDCLYCNGKGTHDA